MEKSHTSGISPAAYPTSDICSGNGPVLHEGAYLPQPYRLVGTWVGQKVHFTSPIPQFQWHATGWRDKGDIFLSLCQRGKLPLASSMKLSTVEAQGTEHRVCDFPKLTPP